jgi:hypothetical protein
MDVVLPLLTALIFMCLLHHSENVIISYRTQNYIGECEGEAKTIALIEQKKKVCHLSFSISQE